MLHSTLNIAKKMGPTALSGLATLAGISGLCEVVERQENKRWNSLSLQEREKEVQRGIEIQLPGGARHTLLHPKHQEVMNQREMEHTKSALKK